MERKNMRDYRIVFMGTPAFAVAVLDAMLAAHWTIAAVFTQPDRPVGRKRVLTSPPVKELAQAHGIAVWQPERLRSAEALATLAACRPDVIVTAAYGQILPVAALEMATCGAFNVHASLLPAYRGAAPIQWAIRKGETVTGVSLMTMVKAMDAGPVWATEEVAIAPEATYGEVHDLLAQAGARLTVKALPDILAGELQPREQDLALVTFAPPLTRNDERIDWTQPAQQIYNHIRALVPTPCAYTELAGLTLKVYAAKLQARAVSAEADGPPGQVIAVTENGPLVRCGDGRAVVLLRLQLAGRSVQSGAEFVRGRKDLVGHVLGRETGAEA